MAIVVGIVGHPPKPSFLDLLHRHTQEASFGGVGGVKLENTNLVAGNVADIDGELLVYFETGIGRLLEGILLLFLR